MVGRHPASRVLLAVTLSALTATVAACSSDSPSTLEPAGPRAHDVTVSWWILFGVAAFVCVLVIGAVVLAVVSRRRARRVSSSSSRGTVVVLGALLPGFVFAGVFAICVTDLARSSNPDHADLTVDVVGHQWWWEVRYPESGAVTANEIHVPVGEDVELRLWSADVIHSFWVPELMPKTDLLPGRVNRTWFRADHTGTFRGQCAEYCGVEHAHMAFTVVVEPRADYERWVADQAAPAPAPTDPTLQRGMEVLSTGTCATCHTVRGTSADGDVGPDLTHVGSRSTLAAGAIPNDEGHLSGWVANSQTVKPGNLMPPQHLAPADLLAVVAYLRSLT
jgi:cytochrome c oxidase subunit 2